MFPGSRGGRHSLLGPLRRAATAQALKDHRVRQGSHSRSPPFHSGLRCGAPHSAGLFGRFSPPTPLTGDHAGKEKIAMSQQQNQTIHQPSLYSQVTDRIIAELEQGIVPWVQPWGSGEGSAGLGLPRNARTAKAYSGINILLLWDAVIRGGYASQSWLTFKQALELGGCVRKGEKGWTVCYADSFIPKDEKERASKDGGDPQAVPFLKRYTVFNVAQCDGLPDSVSPPPTPDHERELVPRAEALIAATGASFQTGGEIACYIPKLDAIRVPPQTAFHDQINYYRTVFHELGHNAVTGIMPHGAALRRFFV